MRSLGGKPAIWGLGTDQVGFFQKKSLLSLGVGGWHRESDSTGTSLVALFNLRHVLWTPVPTCSGLGPHTCKIWSQGCLLSHDDGDGDSS